MKKYALVFSLFCFSLCSLAHTHSGYVSLDKDNPILFKGNSIIYQQKEIPLSEKAFFIDGQLSDMEAARSPFVFNTINEALKHIQDGTETEPMTLYIAPYVYWIDDPDDSNERIPKSGAIPYGLEVKCNWLKFHGLTHNPQHVVLASQRGQTQGAQGNFTMFYFDGDGISSENITFGNYCNVDLEYALNPQLNRPKRSSTVTQAQLIICNSDKVVARNTQFISRLNLCPFTGAKRVLFDSCYFESTDDALCGTGVYLNCRFTFFSSKPFFNTQGTGAVFLNCDIDVLTQGRQYLTKMGSPVTMVDTRFHTASNQLVIDWTPDPEPDLRCYQYNISVNGAPIIVHEDKSYLTVDMTGKPILEAYRVEHNHEVIYNTYNLLCGDDDWDPMLIKTTIKAVEKQTGKKLTDIPTYLKIIPSSYAIESGVTDVKPQAVIQRFGNYKETKQSVNWSLNPKDKELITLAEHTDRTCTVQGINLNEETETVLLYASTPSGLESAIALSVAPRYVEAPRFISAPQLIISGKGKLTVAYELELEGRTDESLITWYRCSDAKGSQPVEVAVSRLNKPKQEYELTDADIGYYIMASVSPKHLRCHPGTPQQAVTLTPITPKDVIERTAYFTDFVDFPVTYQPNILPGFWTVDGYKPSDTMSYDWEITEGDTWYYGTGIDGMKGTGLVQKTRGARLLYTPVQEAYRDMEIVLNVDPGKQAGQGFGSATGQYMDIFIKFDTQTLTGYALRITRTVKYDKAVDFILMKYDRGIATAITEPVSATCYRTDCTIKLMAKGNLLTAQVDTQTVLPDVMEPELKKSVYLQTQVAPNEYGGIGIQHTGSVGANGTMLHHLQIDWK